MNHMLPEGLHPQPEGYTREELLLAMQQRRVLQARAVLCDERHALHVPLGCCEGVIERAEGARGIAGGQTRDLAILSCVGRPVCFHVLGFFPDGRARLSRRSVQEQALDLLLRQRPGDILPAVVTGLAEFGAFCDIGCGALGLLGTRRICMSRPAHAADCLRVGQRIFTAVRTLDPVQRRVVRTVTDYGAFIALTPNLCGLAETDGRLRPGQAVCVFIRAILPETLRIKLTVLHPLEALPPQALVYTRTEGHLDLWRYGTPDRAKAVTIF